MAIRRGAPPLQGDWMAFDRALRTAMVPVKAAGRGVRARMLHELLFTRWDAHHRDLVERARRGDARRLYSIPVAAAVAENLYSKELRALQLEHSLDDSFEIAHDVDVAVTRLAARDFWLNELRASDPRLAEEMKRERPTARVFREALFNNASRNHVRVGQVIRTGGRVAVADVKVWGGRMGPGTGGRLIDSDGVNRVDVRFRDDSVRALLTAAHALREHNDVAMVIAIIDGGTVEGGAFTVATRKGELVVAEFDVAVDKLRALGAGELR